MRLFWALLALQTAPSVESLEPIQTVALAANTYHVQGIVVEGSTAWVSSVDTAGRRGLLLEFTLPEGRLARSVELQDGPRFHPGGISADATSLWVPVAEYRRDSSAVIQKRSRKTLALEDQFSVGDHIGCVAAAGEELIGGNWDTRTLYVWNRRGELIRKVANDTGNAFQDIKFVDGQVVGSGLLADKSGAIDWLEYPSFHRIRRMLAGRTSRGVAYTHEGMAIAAGTLWLLPEDSPSRLFGFRLPPVTIRKPGNLPGDGR